LERRQLISARVAKLTNGFGQYMQLYDQQVSFTSKQLAAHRACWHLKLAAE
jgi:hypothetical protein